MHIVSQAVTVTIVLKTHSNKLICEHMKKVCIPYQPGCCQITVCNMVDIQNLGDLLFFFSKNLPWILCSKILDNKFICQS